MTKNRRHSSKEGNEKLVEKVEAEEKKVEEETVSVKETEI